MKGTYRALAPLVIAFKSLLIPPLLSISVTYSSLAFSKPEYEVYSASGVAVSSAITYFTLELAFIFFVAIANFADRKIQISKRKGKKARLMAMQSECMPQTQSEISSMIKRIEKEIVSLTFR